MHVCYYPVAMTREGHITIAGPQTWDGTASIQVVKLLVYSGCTIALAGAGFVFNDAIDGFPRAEGRMELIVQWFPQASHV